MFRPQELKIKNQELILIFFLYDKFNNLRINPLIPLMNLLQVMINCYNSITWSNCYTSWIFLLNKLIFQIENKKGGQFKHFLGGGKLGD